MESIVLWCQKRYITSSVSLDVITNNIQAYRVILTYTNLPKRFDKVYVNTFYSFSTVKKYNSPQCYIYPF